MSCGLLDGAGHALNRFMQARQVLMKIDSSPQGTEHGEHRQRNAYLSETVHPLQHQAIVIIAG